MSAEKETKRYYLFDNLKFILMALVVIGHCADANPDVPQLYKSIFVFIYSFHMPLFLFISGLFHKNTKIFQKIITFISLGYLSKLIIYLTKLGLYGNATFSFFSDGALPWYMFVLAMFIGVSYLLRNVNKTLVLTVSVLLALIAGYFSQIGDLFYLSRFFVFFPYYLLGQMIPETLIIRLNSSKKIRLLSAVILTVWAIICFTQIDTVYPIRYLLTGRNSFASIEALKVWGFFWRFATYLITIAVSFSVICLAPRKKMPFISKFGRSTLQVYFWQTTVLHILRKIGVTQLIEYPEGRILWLLIGLMVAVLLSTKLFSFPTKQVSALCSKIKK